MVGAIPYAVEPYRPATIECVLLSAVRRNVPANVLLAIGQHEAGTEGSELLNKNRSHDLGRFGINTIHIEELSKLGVSPAVARHYLRFDGCYNADMAAYLIRGHLDRCTKEFYSCVADYHSKTPSKNARYRAIIMPLVKEWERYLSTRYTIKEYRK